MLMPRGKGTLALAHAKGEGGGGGGGGALALAQGLMLRGKGGLVGQASALTKLLQGMAMSMYFMGELVLANAITGMFT